MTDTGWRRNKYGGWFNVNDVNKYMNDKIRNIKDYNENEEDFLTDNSNLIYDPYETPEEQQRAVIEYTRCSGYGDSKMVNGYLNNTRELSDGAKDLIKEKVAALDKIIDKKTKNSFYVYWGVEIKGEKLQVGKIVENKGYTSTSIYRSDAANFGVFGGTTIKVKVPAGTKALYIGENTSNYRNEHELLIERGRSIKITKNSKLFDKSGDFMNYEIEGELI